MGTGVGEAMLIGAATGAGTSAITGGDPLKGALMGAAGGGFGAGVGGALGGQAATAGTAVAPGAATGAIGTAVPESLSATLAERGVQTSFAAPTAQLASTAPVVPQVGFKDLMTGGGDFSSKLGNYLVQNPMQVGSAAGVMGGIGSYELPGMPKKDNYSGPLSRFSYDPDKYRPQMAAGGLADSMPAKRMAMGGHLGSYSDGGRLLKGPGDGMSDDIPAKIGSKQPARLADGEFVVPADVVSGIGNGSTDAGAKKLYAMMNKVRQARTGTKKQGKAIKADKYMPA
jgi:hypothetical protein